MKHKYTFMYIYMYIKTTVNEIFTFLVIHNKCVDIYRSTDNKLRLGSWYDTNLKGKNI